MDYELNLVIRYVGWFIGMYLKMDLLMNLLRVVIYILGLLIYGLFIYWLI